RQRTPRAGRARGGRGPTRARLRRHGPRGGQRRAAAAGHSAAVGALRAGPRARRAARRRGAADGPGPVRRGQRQRGRCGAGPPVQRAAWPSGAFRAA
ncbi:unnamed protein product, partial [Prorocentrum cordatum]